MLRSFLLLTTALLFAGCATQRAPLPTVAAVDLARYAGRWHEIARLPNFFQKAGARATADYTALADGSIKVVNTETHADGTQKSVEGRATAVPGSGQARLRVKFGGLAALAPAAREGNYWIVALAPDYSVALVGTPDRKFLWLLARDPQLSERTRRGWLARARQLGFPVERVLVTQWPGAA